MSKGQDYCWKATNAEGFIPPVAYYFSDRVAKNVENNTDQELTIIGFNEPVSP